MTFRSAALAALISTTLATPLILMPGTAGAQDELVPPEEIPAGEPAPIAEPAPVGEPAPVLDPAAAEAPAPPETVSFTPDEANLAEFTGGELPGGKKADPLVLKLQVLLDRAGYSPGVIDGIMGDNVAKAIVAAEAAIGAPQDGVLDEAVWQGLVASQDAVLGLYTITPEDLAGPFIPDLPSDYGELAKLDRSAFRTPREMFAERFHMDETLLARLNPGIDFGAPGSQIVVANPGASRSDVAVTYIIADKTRKQLLGYDAANRLVVSYPATIGSDELPSPSGVHKVNAVAWDAAYYYRPAVNFQQGNTKRKLTIPPGPNNPIGTTWIDLSEPTYGIHGTPEPSRIDKTNSHGCIRLTNWDAEELAGLVEKGVPVEFR
ncbi:MAG: L,D-transpeptidase [Bauldia litoralis]|uniref:L,D-transpeptidase family protein n=1 Tax=Bauldia litoralis TaxID=665467 RepID=UPI00329709EA